MNCVKRFQPVVSFTQPAEVRNRHLTDINLWAGDVRLLLESRHHSLRLGRPLCANSGRLVVALEILTRVCTENLNPDVLAMKSAKDRV
jgi:hypothetical protein